jgi:hypothetical protein
VTWSYRAKQELSSEFSLGLDPDPHHEVIRSITNTIIKLLDFFTELYYNQIDSLKKRLDIPKKSIFKEKRWL